MNPWKNVPRIGGPAIRSTTLKGNPHLLEWLEPRALLSATLQLIGNGQVIPNKDTKTTPLDFTNFRGMSITVNASIGTASRTFTIKDTGNADLTLTGPTIVTLSGPNAADFSVAVQPSTTITSGNTSTFTINFVPHAAGTRTAKVTIHSNDPAATTFTFTIQGTGLATINNSSNGLQVVTTKTGSGTGAAEPNGTINGSTIVVDYTGYLLNGTVFDSSLFESSIVRGHSPLKVDLGQSEVIAGFEQGLVGIKPGETRTIIMPSALGYGATANGLIPANSPLVFTVTRRKDPSLVVSGNGIGIAFGETSPSPVDGTFIGTIPAGATSNQLSMTYSFAQLGTGAVTLPKAIKITGPQAGDFSSSPVVLGNNNSVGFTITYNPSAPRTSSAIVHVSTSDKDHPDFQFTIGAVRASFNDLAISLGHIGFPAGPAFSGSSTLYNFPIVVTNDGNIPVPNTPVDVQVYVHNTTSGAYTLLTNASFSTTAFAKLAVGATKTLTLPLALPFTLSAGVYDVLMKVDNSDVLQETNTDNNALVSQQQVTVIKGINNITGNLIGLTPGLSTIPANSAINASLKFNIQSAGNLALPTGEKLNIQVVAIDATTQLQTPLGPVSSATVSGWAANHSAAFSATAKLLSGLPAGTYHIAVTVTPSPALAGEANLLLDTDANNAPITLVVT